MTQDQLDHLREHTIRTIGDLQRTCDLKDSLYVQRDLIQKMAAYCHLHSDCKFAEMALSLWMEIAEYEMSECVGNPDIVRK